MKFLHTSDWHVGKGIRGHSRAGEHRAVLAEITQTAADHQVDLILVAGDQFDTAAPSAESESIVYDALLAMAEVAPVVVIAGNHDNPRRLDAVSPLLELGRVHMATTPRRPDDGGVLTLTAGDATPVNIALMPFVSQRAIVRSDALMDNPAFLNAQVYAERISAVINALTTKFTGDAVNIVAAHLFVIGGAVGGGERAVHLQEAYGVSAVDFPATTTYVALGHLHRPQKISGATAIHYCGSPLQLDFGESEEAKQVNIVEADPGLPARVTPVGLTAGRSLITLKGSFDDVASIAQSSPDRLTDAWIRIWLNEAPRPGLADDVKELLGDRVVDVRIEGIAGPKRRRSRHDEQTRTPTEMFADYLSEVGNSSDILVKTFAELHELVGESEGVGR